MVSAAVQIGMSGGGTYNENMELVGIMSAMVDGVTLVDTGEQIPDSTIIVPLLFAEEWIQNVIAEYELDKN